MTSSVESMAAQGLLNLGNTPLSCKTAEFFQQCAALGVTAHSQSVLLQHGVDSLLALYSLRPGDLESVGLPLGQRRLLERMAEPSAPHAPIPSDVASPSSTPIATSELLASASMACRQLGIKGQASDHLRIAEFVTPLSNNMAESGDDHTFELPDGSRFIPKTAARKVKLESVTALQYMEASTKILGRLITDGMISSLTDVLHYLGYTAMVGRLGQKKSWRSVLLYDDSYREAQASEGFAWGKDLRDLRDLHLEDKHTPISKPEVTVSKKESQGSPIKLDSPTQEQWSLCRDFNTASCKRRVCKFLHFCSICGEKSHNAVGHPLNG